MGGRGGRNSVKRNRTPPTSASKKGRKQQPPPSPPIATDSVIRQRSPSNKSEQMLTSDDELSTIDTRSSSSNSHVSNNTQPPIPKTRFPPFFLTTNPNYPWRSIAKLLYNIKAHEYVEAKTTTKPNEIQLNCPDETSFRSIQAFLSTLQDKIGFHSYPPPSQRTLKIVIQGIPLEIPNDEIVDELKLQGYDPIFIRAFSKNGHRLPFHMITLTNIEQAKEIYSLPKLFHAKIKVEPYRTSGPAQCFKCQNFGHSSAQCGHPSRCVKCAGSHASNTCNKPREVTPTCCNCKGEHTANYRGCPYLAKIMSEKSNPRPSQYTPKSTNTFPSLPTLTEKPVPQDQTKQLVSYASITNNSEPTISVTKTIQIIQKLLKSAQHCSDLKTKDEIINTILSIISELSPTHDE